MQARADDAKRKLVRFPEEISAAKTVALAEYQYSAEFEQVWEEIFDDGIRTFIYNHLARASGMGPFLGEAAREMVAVFSVPPETPLTNPPTEFVPLPDQSPEVADRPRQVFNKDSTAVIAGGGGGAEEEDEVMQIDNPASVLSSD